MLKEHNREAYEATKSMLLEYGECCLIAGTGVGKTGTAIEIVKTCKFKTLVICHRNSIISSTWNVAIKSENIDLIDTTTYQYFYRNYNKLYGYDLYIFDEAHHMGSPKWAESIKNFKKNNSGYILGLTADPNRYFEYQNVIDTLFDGCGVYGIQQDEAIEMGILPEADYVMAYFDTEGLYKSQKNKGVSKRLLGKLKYSIHNTMKINDILLHYTASLENIKGIVFVENIQSIEIGIALINKVFPNENISYIHSRLNTKEITDTLMKFYAAKSGFIIAVDMLNEGNHIPGLNTAIMLRKTSSPTVFLQQIGRILDINSISRPIIFDFVGNRDSIERIVSRLRAVEMKRRIINNKAKNCNIAQFSSQLIIHDHTLSILSVLKEIKIELGGKEYWSDEEIRILKENYPTMGRNVCKLLPGRSMYSCSNKAMELGMSTQSYFWSDEEIRILKENYPTMGQNVYKLLPGRSAGTCQTMAMKLRIKHNSTWSKEEDNILKENYPTMGQNVYKLLPGRSARTCTRRAVKLGICSSSWWSDEEIRILKENYPTMGQNVYKLLPGRSAGTCQTKASSLGIVRDSSFHWSDEEIRILKENYPIMGISVCKLLPGRSRGSIRNKVNKLGLSFIKTE